MDKIIFWLSTIFCLFFLGYLFLDTLIPFFIAFIFAYALQPLIDNYSDRFGVSRNIMIMLVFLLFIGILLLLVLLLVPIIYQQITDFVKKVPLYKNNIISSISYVNNSLEQFDENFANKISESLQNASNSMFAIFASFADHLWQYTIATINFFVILVLVPIILFYFLRDWKKISYTVDSLLPICGKGKVKDFFASVNDLLSAYLRGQLNICLILSIYYVVGIKIIGLDLALLFGLISGFFIIIPLIGSIFSFVLVIFHCYFSFGAGIKLFYVISLFAIGHIIEGYILTPRIIGNKIGLHPLWVMFAVFAGASLIGIWGVLFAIPVAGIIRLMLILMLDYYKNSKIYKS